MYVRSSIPAVAALVVVVLGQTSAAWCGQSHWPETLIGCTSHFQLKAAFASCAVVLSFWGCAFAQYVSAWLSNVTSCTVGEEVDP